MGDPTLGPKFLKKKLSLKTLKMTMIEKAILGLWLFDLKSMERLSGMWLDRCLLRYSGKLSLNQDQLNQLRLHWWSITLVTRGWALAVTEVWLSGCPSGGVAYLGWSALMNCNRLFFYNKWIIATFLKNRRRNSSACRRIKSHSRSSKWRTHFPRSSRAGAQNPQRLELAEGQFS